MHHRCCKGMWVCGSSGHKGAGRPERRPFPPKASALTASWRHFLPVLPVQSQQLNHLGLMRSDARASKNQAGTRKISHSRPTDAAISIDRAIGYSIDTTENHHIDRPDETCEGQASSRRMAMTATSTRSTRRAESSSNSNGLVAHPPQAHPHLHPQHPHPHRTTATATRLHHHNQQNSGRPLKRLHDATNLRYDLQSPKKTKITVEIPSRTQYQARLFPGSVESRQQQHKHRPAGAHQQTPTKPHDQHCQPAPARSPTKIAPVPTPEPPTTTTTPDDKASALTKHQEKVVNGIKHELDRLQPSSADMAASNSQGRKLRSQEGVRFKSELSAYFPEYDEVIGNIPKEYRTCSPMRPSQLVCTRWFAAAQLISCVPSDVLMLETPIVIVDTSPSSASTSLPLRGPHSTSSTYPIRTYGDDLFTNLHDSQIIDLSWLESQYEGKALNDPLADSYYEPIHRKESRNEKITRNAEKGRSQHEKAQVIRLLEGLRGPDWLRTMGVSGITEGKKKQFEPARAHFVQKCEVVLDKFARWAAEEKRLKLEKERAAKESRASRDASSSDAEESDEVDAEDDVAETPAVEEDVNKDGEEAEESDGDPPDMSDVDASAKQLHEEAMARSRLAAKSVRRRPMAMPPPPPPQPEFTSFFKKRWQRDTALNKSRRRGRTVLAWGQPIPEPEEHDFELPEEYRDEDMLRARARRMRSLRRGSRHRG